MRRGRYAVATSLDGYIAGPNGEADWIIFDPDIDFGALFEQFDTFLMGRRTFEGMGGAGGWAARSEDDRLLEDSAPRGLSEPHHSF
jgi:dihydrofolate reductase